MSGMSLRAFQRAAGLRDGELLALLDSGVLPCTIDDDGAIVVDPGSVESEKLLA